MPAGLGSGGVARHNGVMDPHLDDTVLTPVRLGRHDPAVPHADTLPRDAAANARRAARHAAEHAVEAAPGDPSIPPSEPTTSTVASNEPEAPGSVSTSCRIRIGPHHLLALEQPVLVGRRPMRPRIDLHGRPLLVRVPSPLGEVSSTHVEFRQVGQAVLVTDLRSTNGTSVTAPGAARRIVQGESVVVSPPATIDIGDGNVIEVLEPGPLDAPGPAPTGTGS